MGLIQDHFQEHLPAGHAALHVMDVLWYPRWGANQGVRPLRKYLNHHLRATHKYKSKIKKCKRKMQRAGGSEEPAGKRVQRGATHGQGKGTGSKLPGADTALDGTFSQHGKGLPALFWSLKEDKCNQPQNHLETISSQPCSIQPALKWAADRL